MINFDTILSKIKLKHLKEKEYYIEDEDYDMITDEIEKSLIEIKRAYNLPSEEIEMSILSRRNSRNNKK